MTLEDAPGLRLGYNQPGTRFFSYVSVFQPTLHDDLRDFMRSNGFLGGNHPNRSMALGGCTEGRSVFSGLGVPLEVSALG